jgi:hypothetical protein
LSLGKNTEATLNTVFNLSGKNGKISGSLLVPVSLDSCAVYVANINAKKLTYKKVISVKKPKTTMTKFEYTIKTPFKNKTTGIEMNHTAGLNNSVSTSYYLGGYVVKVVCKKNGKVYTTKSAAPIIVTSQAKGYTYHYSGWANSRNKYSGISSCYISPVKGKDLDRTVSY